MSKTKIKQGPYGADRDLYSGPIRLHVLHHAVDESIFGLGMIEELARYAYKIGPGSLYPLLHGLEIPLAFLPAPSTHLVFSGLSG